MGESLEKVVPTNGIGTVRRPVGVVKRETHGHHPVIFLGSGIAYWNRVRTVSSYNPYNTLQMEGGLCWVVGDERLYSALEALAPVKRIPETRPFYEGMYRTAFVSIGDRLVQVLHCPHPNGLFAALRLLHRRGIRQVEWFVPGFMVTKEPEFPEIEDFLLPVKRVLRRGGEASLSGGSGWQVVASFGGGTDRGIELYQSLIPLIHEMQLLNCPREWLGRIFSDLPHDRVFSVHGVELRCSTFVRGWLLHGGVNAPVYLDDELYLRRVEEFANLIASNTRTAGLGEDVRFSL